MRILKKYPWLTVGLDQIPTRDLKRLKKELEDKKSKLIFDGNILAEDENCVSRVELGY